MDYKHIKEQLAELEAELVILRKRKTAFKGHGTNTTQISAEIKSKQAQARKLRKALKQPLPASAYSATLPHGKRPILQTLDAQKRPVQGGGVSPK